MRRKFPRRAAPAPLDVSAATANVARALGDFARALETDVPRAIANVIYTQFPDLREQLLSGALVVPGDVPSYDRDQLVEAMSQWMWAEIKAARAVAAPTEN